MFPLSVLLFISGLVVKVSKKARVHAGINCLIMEVSVIVCQPLPVFPLLFYCPLLLILIVFMLDSDRCAALADCDEVRNSGLWGNVCVCDELNC